MSDWAKKVFLDAVYESVSSILIVLDAEGRIEFINPSAEKLFGYSKQELIGKAIEILIPERFRSAHVQYRLEFMLDPKPRPMGTGRDLWAQRKDGTEFPVEISLIPKVTDRGTFVLVILVDITERKKIEDVLKSSEMKYRMLVETTNTGYLITDSQGKVEDANAEYVRLSGHSELSEILGRSFLEWTAEHAKRENAEAFARCLKERVVRGFTTYYVGRNGRITPIAINATVQGSGQSLKVIALCRDITEQKEIEEKLRYAVMNEHAARIEADKANQIKDLFLATLSHELRTPLTAILSWVQLLRSGRLDIDKTRRGFEVLEQSVKVQEQLINDLLDISRIQAGKLNLEIQEFDLSRVISSVIDSIRSLAAHKSIQIEVFLDPTIKNIFADPNRIHQILCNLITNSIKFSPPNGRIWIRAEPFLSSIGEYIRIQVRDTGKGIKPEFLPIIFERFTQVDSSTTRAYGGMGLGLAIVKKLVEMHNGIVEAESPGEGKGATFSVFLPKKPMSRSCNTEVETEIEASVVLRGLRVLLVEDNHESREVISILLQSFGVEVKAVESAREALAVIDEFKPDVLVSDIAMPIEDGYSLMGKIRAMKSIVGNVPALALTAYGGQEDIQRAHWAGFQSHITKPVDAKKLALTIARLAGRK